MSGTRRWAVEFLKQPVIRAAFVAELAKLSEKQQRVILPNGKRAVYLDRIGRGLTYLKLWGAVDSPRRGQQIISEKGAELIRHYPQGIPAEVVAEIVLTARKAGTQPNTKESIQALENNIADVAESTSEELTTESVAQLESALATIFWSACVLSPSTFEQLVVDVLLAMGYGGSEGLQASNDGGINGVIDQDALGLSKIYVQAKRYGEKNSVGRPEVQSFVGAMHGQASQGVFITSGSFTSGARNYAQNLGGGLSLVLIDGERLARLMVKYRVGVQVARTYMGMKLDEDFFEES
ncbi:restriction endonuclease [Rothia dentocariosa]|uniref:restriction endonuclease n=1 Tax=Rothia dentocariosa TaxID=2047 RepID=UPI0028EECB75|nr:restriction endonuclease [Rothia dentocariosa]